MTISFPIKLDPLAIPLEKEHPVQHLGRWLSGAGSSLLGQPLTIPTLISGGMHLTAVVKAWDNLYNRTLFSKSELDLGYALKTERCKRKASELLSLHSESDIPPKIQAEIDKAQKDGAFYGSMLLGVLNHTYEPLVYMLTEDSYCPLGDYLACLEDIWSDIPLSKHGQT